jgi:hypothetical protein
VRHGCHEGERRAEPRNDPERDLHEESEEQHSSRPARAARHRVGDLRQIFTVRVSHPSSMHLAATAVMDAALDGAV